MDTLQACPHRVDGRCTQYDIHERWCSLCLSKPAYKTLWAAGRGPGQSQGLPQPSRHRRVLSYAKAVAGHVLTGARKRSPEEIARIYETICKPCSLFNPDTGSCTICGCCVNKSASALRNKIAMASQHCPDSRTEKW